MGTNTNSYVYASDTANIQAGGTSFFDDVTDAFVMGGGSAVVSGLSSIYNTGVEVANYFGAEAEKIDVHKNLSDFDANWGEYYKQHQGAIDLTGFIATSFIPGGLAVKGLNLARRGEGAGAFARSLNYSTEAQKLNLEKALQTIASPEGSVFTKLNANYLKAIGWGAADQVLQTAAFEVAVVATMAASPILEGKSAGELGHDIVVNALFGGAFGGAIEGVILNGITNRARKAVDATQRKYDVLGANLEKTKLEDTDVAYSFIDSALKLPKEVFESDRALEFTYRLNGKINTVPGGLRTGELYDKALQKTITNAYNDFERLLTNNLAQEGDTTVGKPFAAAMLDIMAQGKAQKLDNDTIRARMADHLFNLEKVEPIGDQIPNVTPETLYYFNKKADLSKKETPFTKDEAAAEIGAKTFRILGDADNIKIAVAGVDAQITRDAWEQGFDMYIRPDQTWAVNPKSKILRPMEEPKSYQTIFNTRNGQTVETDVAAITAADIATKETPLSVTGKHVIAGKKKWEFGIEDGTVEMAGLDSTDFTARHLWASTLKSIDGTVDARDISVLDKMSSNKQIVKENTLVNVDGDVKNWRDLGNFDDFVFNRKLTVLQERLNAGEQDIQALAYELNTTPQWIQDAIASKFNPVLNKHASNAPDLSSGWQRPLEEYANRENVILNYKKQAALYTDDFGNTFEGKRFAPRMTEDGSTYMANVEGHRAFITGQQAYHYRVKLAQDNLDMAHATVFGVEDAARFINVNDDELAQLADRNNSGAGITSFSDASYGDKLRMFMQETGKQVHLLTQKISNGYNSRLQPLMQLFRQDTDDARKAAAELTAVVTRVRRSADKYTLLGADHGFDGAYMVERSLIKGSTPETLAAVKDALLTGSGPNIKAFHIESDLTANFLKEWQSIMGDINEKRGVLAAATGRESRKHPGDLYVPPIDTTKVPYFAFVRPTEGKAFSTSEVSMITARSDSELQALAAQISGKDGLEVIYKKDTERFFKAKGDYDYQRALNETNVDSQLKKEGRLGDFLPSFGIETTLEDFLNFTQRQSSQLVRDGVSTKYSQLISELSRLSEQYTLAQTSKLDLLGKLTNRTLKDPYDDVIKGMLDVSKRSEFTLLHQTNEMLDAIGTRAYRAMEKAYKGAAAGTVTWQEANDVLTRYGLGKPFDDQIAFEIANKSADRNLLKTTLQKANMVLSNAVLRFDFANSLINIISTPIMLGAELSSIRNSIKNDPKLVGALAELTTLAVPGTTERIPSTTGLIAQAIKNYWGKDKDLLIKRYTDNGDINSVTAMFHEMTTDLSLTPNIIPKDYSKGVDKWIERTAKISGNTFAEQFTRFVSADVMRQLTDPLVAAKRMSIQEQNGFMSIFVNRVQGNYIASQRPILFQGTLGSALGLFQTYQFNMMQQLFRHIENRDLKTIAVMGGLQTSIYGLNGLPLFDAINTHIIGNASINDGHRDAYSFATEAAGKDIGNWLMYGTASAMPIFGGQGPALYTRGDVNPRHVSIIPISPLDIPAVDGTVRFVTNLLNTGSKLGNGADVKSALLEGLEHNSINRPLAGLAQVINGRSTTSKGSLIATTGDMFSIGNASRVLGAKPMDEAVGLNTRYRQLAYQAEDRERITALGAAVKTTLAGGNSPSNEQMTDFMAKYAAAGGRVDQFGKAMQKWSKDANQSVLNQLSDKVRSPYGQRFVEVMGGTRLPDYTSIAPTEDPTLPSE